MASATHLHTKKRIIPHATFQFGGSGLSDRRRMGFSERRSPLVAVRQAAYQRNQGNACQQPGHLYPGLPGRKALLQLRD